MVGLTQQRIDQLENTNNTNSCNTCIPLKKEKCQILEGFPKLDIFAEYQNPKWHPPLYNVWKEQGTKWLFFAIWRKQTISGPDEGGKGNISNGSSSDTYIPI